MGQTERHRVVPGKMSKLTNRTSNAIDLERVITLIICFAHFTLSIGASCGACREYGLETWDQRHNPNALTA